MDIFDPPQEPTPHVPTPSGTMAYELSPRVGSAPLKSAVEAAGRTLVENPPRAVAAPLSSSEWY